MGNYYSKKEFVKLLNRLEYIDSFNDKLNELFADYNEDGFVILPNCICECVGMLERMYEDDGQWISYYIFELNYGHYWKPGAVTYSEGKEDIPLGTPDNLWDFLIRNLREKYKDETIGVETDADTNKG